MRIGLHASNDVSQITSSLSAPSSYSCLFRRTFFSAFALLNIQQYHYCLASERANKEVNLRFYCV